MIPLFRPRQLRGKYLGKVLKSRHLTTGPMVERLREKLGEYFATDSPRIVLGSSATECFRALVTILPPMRYRFSSPTWPLMERAAESVLRHPPRRLEEAFVATDIGGARSPLSHSPGLPLVHDACHGWVFFPGESLFTLFSFYPTKLCGAAEGGVLICRNQNHAEEIQLLLNAGLRGAGQSPDYQAVDPAGRKANMTDVQAALALEALEDLPSRKEEATEHWWDLYNRIPDSIVFRQAVQPYLFQTRPAGWDDVATFREKMAELGVATGWNFPPSRQVTLPCWGLTRKEREKVARAYEACHDPRIQV